MKQRTFPELCFVILMNEIEPRKEKYGFYIPALVAHKLSMDEFNGVSSRKVTREKLDQVYELLAITETGDTNA
jgi:hypothetical protein